MSDIISDDATAVSFLMLDFTVIVVQVLLLIISTSTWDSYLRQLK